MSTFQIEKDAIVFLGLLSIAYKNFDVQFRHADGEPTHTIGLNIFAAIIDNTDGEVIGQNRNSIHAHCNPMLHAEQLTLKDAIETLQVKRPRNPDTTSVENYYRKFLFNQPDTIGNFDVGSTIYTTLEPCPFCTSALLVTRMKRIVYIIPDTKYGSSFTYLKEMFYKSYDITYEAMTISILENSSIVMFANKQFENLVDYVQKHPQTNGALLLDDLQTLLSETNSRFISFTEKDLVTESNDKNRNRRTLAELQERAK